MEEKDVRPLVPLQRPSPGVCPQWAGVACSDRRGPSAPTAMGSGRGCETTAVPLLVAVAALLVVTAGHLYPGEGKSETRGDHSVSGTPLSTATANIENSPFGLSSGDTLPIAP